MTSKHPITEIENNLFSFLKLFNHWRRTNIHDTKEMLMLKTNIPCPIFNSISRADLSTDVIEETLDKLINEYQSASLPILWWISPSTRPADLGQRLLARGFQVEKSIGMACNLRNEYPHDSPRLQLSIRRVKNNNELKTWCYVMCTAFGMSNDYIEYFYELFSSIGLDSYNTCRHYLAFDKDKAVATSTMLINDSVAGFYNIATIEEFRNMGIGSAMMNALITESISKKCKLSILHASQSGFNLYKSFGFNNYCNITQYSLI
ncbi:GNAT family N-acetyltransferase [Prochlorococcus marinus]|uniref:N-acetyltransferase domain-containing protein n=1 Tax=Prochlorococcus marinus (strain MIT 9303) TaxID=59922 RepID=A2C8M3_PROM3|nr:GNAT family N-acetyltransferase [Prochlorococcus marinus]ABM77833.1 Hypothetical protein P9303_10841 [Prochlorococcus marinus str. MIT 9303]